MPAAAPAVSQVPRQRLRLSCAWRSAAALAWRLAVTAAAARGVRTEAPMRTGSRPGRPVVEVVEASRGLAGLVPPGCSEPRSGAAAACS